MFLCFLMVSLRIPAGGRHFLVEFLKKGEPDSGFALLGVF